MHLTRFSSYSLRVLMYLSLRPDERVTIRSISEAYGISRNHLMKVVSMLARLDYVSARPGPGGGLTLSRPADEINLADVIRDTEEDMELVACFADKDACVASPACRLRYILNSALDAFMDELANYTVADLALPQDKLAPLLGIPARGAGKA